MTKKNGEERSSMTTSSTDDSVPKVNPVKWTVMNYFIYLYEKIFFRHKDYQKFIYFVGW